MKKQYFILLLYFSIILFTSCEKYEKTLLGNYISPVLSVNSGSTNKFDLEEALTSEKFICFNWKPANYGFPTATEYILQMDKKDNNFTNDLTIGTTLLEYKISFIEMNNILLNAGLQPNEYSILEFQVMASINSAVDTLYSNSLLVELKPFKMEINYPSIYCPGSYQSSSGYEADWIPDKAPQLYSLNSNNIYEGYVYFGINSSQFKFTEEPNWNTNWGDSFADGKLDTGGDNIQLEESGYYKINVDLNNLSYNLLKTNWGVIGSATPGGWASDQDLTYDIDNKIWTITLDLETGEIKFRANDSWGLSYGETNDGVLDTGDAGKNIPVNQAGNYTIELNFNGPRYTYELIKN